jgi:hypothetical protein
MCRCLNLWQVLREKASYVSLDARASMELESIRAADVIIVDPPRRGLDPEVVNVLRDVEATSNISVTPYFALCKMVYSGEILCSAIKRIIYISCNADALERDLKELLLSPSTPLPADTRHFAKPSSGWKVASAAGIMLFPGSQDHLESVVVLDRIKSPAAKLPRTVDVEEVVHFKHSADAEDATEADIKIVTQGPGKPRKLIRQGDNYVVV